MKNQKLKFNIKPVNRLGSTYTKHSVFLQLRKYIAFYKQLSFHIMNWTTPGIVSHINIDTYTFSSIQGTLESIKDVLRKGRINDGYALLRKYYDSPIINIYTILYLEDNSSLNNFNGKEIDNWLKGVESIPEYRIISKYIKDSKKLTTITKILNKDERYKKLRDRCNDHTHYNFYHNLLLNDNEIDIKDRVKELDLFLQDLNNLFIQHFSYLFTLKYNYMMSSDCTDYLDIGMKPEVNSQYWVAKFIQDTFNKIIKRYRPDIASEIKNNTVMELH